MRPSRKLPRKEQANQSLVYAGSIVEGAHPTSLATADRQCLRSPIVIVPNVRVLSVLLSPDSQARYMPGQL